jgi:hypothetical protein
MKKKQIWVSDALYKEIIYAQSNLKKKRGDKHISILETTERLGEYLNSIRNNKIY